MKIGKYQLKILVWMLISVAYGHLYSYSISLQFGQRIKEGIQVHGT